MLSVREKFFQGEITAEELMNEAVSRSVDSLIDDQRYEVVKILGVGAFGTVIQAKNQQGQNLAIKIVLHEYVNRSEVQTWGTLWHENILPLIDIQYLPSGGTFAFMMPLVSTSLDKLLEHSKFSNISNGLEIAKSYLQDVVRGLTYLHRKKLCHLDVKTSNVLITESGTAILCDFSSLTETEAAADSYVSPRMYRPPEAAIIKDGKQAIVNGFSYDVYTVGILALELFTNEALFKSCVSLEANSQWCEKIYPKIFEVIKKKNFRNAVKKAFSSSNVDRKMIDVMRNFVKGCICMNPKFRVSSNDMLDHELFGGRKIFPTYKNDIWEKKATTKKLNFLTSLFIGKASSLSLPPDSGNSAESVPNQNLENESPRPVEENQIQTDYEKVVLASKCKLELRMSKREMFLHWIARKKTALHGRLNRIITALRISRK